MTIYTVALTMLAAAAGALFGWAYFSLLRRAVRAFVARPSWQRLLGGSGTRLLAAAATLTVIAKLGPAALVAALLGFLLTRTVLLRKYGRPQAVRAEDRR